MVDAENQEELLRCRCSDCGTAKQRPCNSSRLRELLGNLFNEVSTEKFQGLYCRHEIDSTGEEIDAQEYECLCPECEFTKSNRLYFCRSVGISGAAKQK